MRYARLHGGRRACAPDSAASCRSRFAGFAPLRSALNEREIAVSREYALHADKMLRRKLTDSANLSSAGAGLRWRPLRSRSTDRADRRDHPPALKEREIAVSRDCCFFAGINYRFRKKHNAKLSSAGTHSTESFTDSGTILLLMFRTLL